VRWTISPLLELGARCRSGADQGGRNQSDAAGRGHEAKEWKHPCHYLWRGPMYVKHNGDVYPCCQSYIWTASARPGWSGAARRDLE